MVVPSTISLRSPSKIRILSQQHCRDSEHICPNVRQEGS
jgi:hypothetical protein